MIKKGSPFKINVNKKLLPVNIRVDHKLWQEVKILTAVLDTTKTDFLRQALKEYIKKFDPILKFQKDRANLNL